MGLKALLFDVDGTLADTEPQGHLPAYNQAFAELGLNWHWDELLYRDLLTQPGGRERLTHYIREYQPELGKYQEEASADLAGFVNRIHAVKSRYFYERVKRGDVPLRPGVRRLMREADNAGIKVGIVTNASAASLEPFLAYTLTDGLMDCVDAVISGEQVSRKKPAPDLYQQALRTLQVSASESIAIEDSAMGHDAAVGAGIPVIITLNDDTRMHDFSDALLVVEDLGEPDIPLQVVAGDCGSHQHIDIHLLQKLVSGGIRS